MIRFPQKLLIPAAARATVARPQQQDQLGRLITSHQATILSAPAGWGKTTMLAAWAQTADLPVAWCSLDAADRDPYQLLGYLLAAVAPLVAEAEELARRLPHVRPGELPLFLRECAAAIAGAPQPFALILDDVHLLTDGEPGRSAELFPDVMDFLATLIDYTRSCHLVLASRTLPRGIPGLIRQVALQRVAVLDYLALQWDADGVSTLAASYGLALPLPAAANLARRYDGWVVGIVLALDSAARQSQPGGPLELADDTGQVYAFFAEQIVAPLPADLQRFLEQTSVLDDLSAQRCNALCRRNDAAVLLEDLLGRGLFLSRRGGWLSYHSLFRDFLRARLARDAAHEREMLERAGDLYAAEDAVERAVSCYCQAGLQERARDLLRAALPRYRQRAQQTTLIQCLDILQSQADRSREPYGLPADLLLARARLYSDLAVWERAYIDLTLAEISGDQEIAWEAQFLHADILALKGSLGEASDRLQNIPPAEELPARLRQLARYTAGRLAILAGRVADGVDLLQAALKDSAAAEASPDMLARIYDLLGYGYAVSGKVGDARRALQRAEACWQIGGDSGRRALTLNNIGTLALDEGRLADARSALTSALALAQETSRRREEAIIRLSLADLALFDGELVEARGQFASAYQLAEQAQVAAEREGAIAGAALTAALCADATASDWLDQLPGDRVPGRASLARTLLTRSPSERAALLAGIPAGYAGLGALDAAIFDLLVADDALACSPGATLDWPALDRAAIILPDPVLRRLGALLHVLPTAAPAASALARRLREPAATAPRPRWAVRALGQFACLIDERQIELSPLHRTLLTRLVDVGPGGMSVDQLWEDVWGDTHIVMGTLHKALSRLREQTGMPIAARAGHCSVEADWAQIAYDVQDFERALADPSGAPALQRAIAAYAGEFLPAAASGAQLWADARRTYLRQRYLGALDQLAALLESAEPERAMGLYQQAFQIDRSREQTAARLIALAARQGNHRLAQETFAQLRDALDSLGLAPLPSTESLSTRLR